MAIDAYMLYLATLAVFFAAPPDSTELLVVSNSLRHGLRRSLWVIFGDLSANSVQMTAAAFGLAALVATSADAFLWIKWVGVAYLFWLGLRLLLTKEKADAPDAAARGRGRLFRQGFTTSMTNPYAVIFFGALFPQFIDAGASIWPHLLILGATYLVIDGLQLMFWGWLGVRARDALGSFSFGALNKVSGALMIGAAGLLAVKDFEPQR